MSAKSESSSLTFHEDAHELSGKHNFKGRLRFALLCLLVVAAVLGCQLSDVGGGPDGGGTGSAPAIPTGLGVVGTTTSSLSLSWSASDSADSYILYRNGSSVYSGSDTYFTDTGLAPSTTYSYTVKATNEF